MALNPDFERGRGGPPDTRGARMTAIGRDMILKVTTGARDLWQALTLSQGGGEQVTASGGTPTAGPNPPMGAGQGMAPPTVAPPMGWRNQDARREPWMGPGQPPTPIAPREDVLGRAFNYQPFRNLNAQPRASENVSFGTLRRVADAFDLVRLAIETRKDQMGKLKFSILPKKKQKDELRASPTPACQRLEDSLIRPDRRLSWDMWLRMLLEDVFVIDAPAIYVRRKLNGEVDRLEIIDGTTITPLLDKTGRMPLPPEPAYIQQIHGMPAVLYTADELIYMPRNPRPGRIYGMSPVEQILGTVNIALRRETAKLNYYTEGNVPEALVSVPKDWTPAQIAEYQVMFDQIMANSQARPKMKFVPGEMSVQFTRDHASLMDTFDEWLARVVMYAFSLPPLPFVKMQNRATADTAYETAIEEGLQPMMLWVENLMNHIIQEVHGERDLEFVWDDIEKVEKAERDAADRADMQQGIISMDEVRAIRGLPPLGMKNAIFGMGPNGMMFVDDIVAAHAQGLMKIRPPMPQGFPGMPGEPGFIDGEVVPEAGMMPPGAPAALGAPAAAGPPGAASQVGDLLAGVDPRLLAAVGLGPEGRGARTVDVTEDEERESDPLAPHAASPHVLDTLRAFERRNGRR